ncbi:serine acetyltransferase, partial [Klebsiella pneumoniae]|nr:serine acetyltransferase [Klebsiella pneumoniae]
MAAFDLEGVVRALDGIRAQWRTSQQRAREPGEREFPSREALADIFDKFKR